MTTLSCYSRLSTILLAFCVRYLFMYDFIILLFFFFFFSSRRRHTRSKRDWSSDVCSSDLRLQRLGCSDRTAGTEAAARNRHVRAAQRERARPEEPARRARPARRRKIGRASCRERV